MTQAVLGDDDEASARIPRAWRMALVLFRQLNVGFLLFRILIVVLLLLLIIRTVFKAYCNVSAFTSVSHRL